MQPLSVSDMREGLRTKTLQSVSSSRLSNPRVPPRVATMPCQRIPPPRPTRPRGPTRHHANNYDPCLQVPSSTKSIDEIANLRQKIKEMEDERSAFFQEGVFDLISFLNGSLENLTPNASPWTLQVMQALAGSKLTGLEELKEENAHLGKALRIVANACALTPRGGESLRDLADRLVYKFS